MPHLQTNHHNSQQQKQMQTYCNTGSLDYDTNVTIHHRHCDMELEHDVSNDCTPQQQPWNSG